MAISAPAASSSSCGGGGGPLPTDDRLIDSYLMSPAAIAYLAMLSESKTPDPMFVSWARSTDVINLYRAAGWTLGRRTSQSTTLLLLLLLLSLFA